MPFPDVNSEFETLLEPTRIWLFGKPFKSIVYVPEDMWGLPEGHPQAESLDPARRGQRVPSRAGETPRATDKWTDDFREAAGLRPLGPETDGDAVQTGPASDDSGSPAQTAPASEGPGSPAPTQSGGSGEANIRRHAAEGKAAYERKECITGEDEESEDRGDRKRSKWVTRDDEDAALDEPKFRANEFTNYKARDPDADPYARDNMPMPPRRIERKLRQKHQQFVRIYSFSFEGHYYRLPRPLLFLLSGPGQRPDEDRKAEGMFERHVAFSTKTSGTASRDWQFGDDIRVWAVDRKDLAVCLDVEVANYHELLLNSMVAGRGSASRGDMVSRGDVVGRGDGGTASRSAGAGAFRGDMIGPHQNW